LVARLFVLLLGVGGFCGWCYTFSVVFLAGSLGCNYLLHRVIVLVCVEFFTN